ncbi:FACT complex subunit [Tulasnella sp. UAMH 9824]|nr:FACT complex subunit [Tulasnella sp. UAMH 9824]
MGVRPKPIVSNSTLVNDSSPELSPAERSILARQESMQRLKELKYAREARNAPAGVETGLRTVLPSRVFTSGQVIAAQAREETTMMAAAPSASTSATVSASVAPLPGAERTYPARQEAMIQEVSPEAGPGNTEVTLEFAPQAGVPSVQGKNKGRAPAHDDMVEMRLFVPGPRARGSDEEQSDTEVNDVSAAQAFRDMIKEKAEIRQVTGECIATFGDILAQTPRGLYDIDMFPSFLRLRGKTYDYGVLYSSVTRIFLLPKRDEIHVQLVVGLDPPIRQGQTKYPYLVLNFNREEELDIELNIDQETIDSKYEGKLQRMYDDQTYRVVSNVFRGLSGRKMIGLGSFASRDNQPGIKANMRAVTGELYFLEKSLIFVAKQATVIDYADIHQIVFSRSEHSIASARTFDIGVVTKCGPVSKVAFTSINKEEFEPVEDFLKAKKMRTKNEINVLAFTALDDDDSDEDMEGGSGEDVPRKKPNFDDDEYIEAAPKKKKKAALKKEKEEDEEMADVNEEKPKPKPKAKAKVKEEAADADGPPKKKVEKYSPS